MSSATTLLDNIGLLPIEINHTVPVYPFTVQGDFSTLIITRTYRQLAIAYQPGQPGITTDTRPSNAEDGVIYYPDAYLISPENVRPIGVAGVVEFSRTFARIPPTHYEPASRLFDRPVMHDVKSGTAYAVSFDNGVTSHVFTSRKTITAVGSPLATGIRSFTCTSHGASVGNRVALYNGDKIHALSTVQLVSDANTFSVLTVDAGDATGLSITACVFAKDADDCYATGPIDCSAQIAVRFYLPGVSPGISEISDIPNFTPVTDPVGWLGAVVSYAASPSPATYNIIETSALERWLDGPIIVKRVTTLQLSDALTTLATVPS